MPKYLVIQRCAPGTGKQEPPSPARMQERSAAFNAWQEKFKANIVDMGGKLKPAGRILNTSGITDGPFIETQGDDRRVHDRHRRKLRPRARGRQGVSWIGRAWFEHRDTGVRNSLKTDAMLKMVKLDIATLQKAYRG